MQFLTSCTQVLNVALILIFLATSFPTKGVSQGGLVWTSVGPDGGAINAIAIDLTTPTTLYAGTSGGVFKSTDSGGNWTAVNMGLGVNGLDVRTLAINPTTPTTLYAGTDGSSVFRGVESTMP
jgi:hypothetical protein